MAPEGVDERQDAIARLAEGWGRGPLAFDRWLVDPADAPVSLEELGRLLAKLPPENILLRRSAATPDSAMEKWAGLPAGRRLEELLRDECVHVMVLDLERFHPGYQSLLARFVDRVRPVLRASGVTLRRSMIGLFLSSPRSLTYFHADSEHNFLFQISGTKEVHVFPNDDPVVFPWEDRESLFCARKHQIGYRKEFESKATVVALSPGMSSYQPALCPHWVEAGPDVAVSIGFSLFTSAERRKHLLFQFNRRMRRLGVRPGAAGRSAFRDEVKIVAAGTLSGVARAVRLLKGR